MDRRNKHLNSEERGVIFAEHQRGNSQRGIGRLLGRPASTISRELARGRQDDGGYCPQAARRVYDERRARCRRKRKLVEGDDLYRFVHGKLVHLRWSPEQIANRLRRMKPDDPAAHVSHETIYAAIYAQPRGGLKDAMIEALRQSKPKRGNKRRTAAASSMVRVRRPKKVIPRIRIKNSPEFVAMLTEDYVNWVRIFSVCRMAGPEAEPAVALTFPNGRIVRNPVAREGRSERPQSRTFDLRSISSSATGVEVFRCAAEKDYAQQRLTSSAPNWRSHQVRRILAPIPTALNFDRFCAVSGCD
jgi:hypothetical protein